MKKIKKDVVVIGGGIAGLFITYKLSMLGINVLLVENQDILCAGPSTRNGGKLHRGTFHSALINDEKRALQTARRCIYGYDQIKSFAPETIDSESMPNYAVIQGDAFAKRALKRWKEIDVFYKEISYTKFSKIIPGVEKSYAKHIFQVLDAPINYKMLYQKLVYLSEKNGAQFLLGANLVPEGKESNKASITIGQSSEKVEVAADYFVYTSGYNSKEILAKYFPNTVELRLWKNHSLIFPRFTHNGFFSIEPGLPSVMPQGSYSIVCQSQEDTLMEKPNFDVNTTTTDGIFQSLVNVMPSVEKYRNVYKPVACMKPDVISSQDPSRSVNVEIHSLSPYHFLALPGKATEVPYLADEFVRIIYDKFADKRISKRSGELFTFES